MTSHISFQRIILRRFSASGEEGDRPSFPSRFLFAPNSSLGRRGQTLASLLLSPATEGLSPSSHPGNQGSVPFFPFLLPSATEGLSPSSRHHPALQPGGVVKMRRVNGNAEPTHCCLPEITCRSPVLVDKVAGYAGIFLVSNVQSESHKATTTAFPLIPFISRSFPYPFHP